MSFQGAVSIALLLLVLVGAAANGQTANAPARIVAGIPVNYDEALVGSHTLPNALVLANGRPVRDAKTSFAIRWPEIVHLLEKSSMAAVRAPGTG